MMFFFLWKGQFTQNIKMKWYNNNNHKHVKTFLASSDIERKQYLAEKTIHTNESHSLMHADGGADNGKTMGEWRNYFDIKYDIHEHGNATSNARSKYFSSLALIYFISISV